MATFRLPDTPGVPAEVRCKHCGQRILLADVVASAGAPRARGPTQGTPHTKPRVTAANQAVRIRVPTDVRKLGFEPQVMEPVDEDGATRSEPVPEALARMAAPRPVPSPAAEPSAGGSAGANGAAPSADAGSAPPPSGEAAPPERPAGQLPTGRERPVPTKVVAELPTASLSQPSQAPRSPRPPVGAAPAMDSSNPDAQDALATRAYPVPEGLGLPGVDSSESATVMRPTPAGLTRAAARYRRTSPAVAVQPPHARLPSATRAPARRPGSQPAPRGAAPPQHGQPWVPSPALWAFVGALLGAAIIALLFALLR